MESCLIISRTEKSIAFFSEMVKASSYEPIMILSTCGEARRWLASQDFDLVIINAPLQDESGESLAREIASQGVSQVILAVKAEYYEEISAVCENYGVLTIAKPLNKTLFWSVLKVAKAAQNRLRKLYKENSKLTQKIEDIRIVDRAKYLLISHLQISEQEAHRVIEKQAMDTRMTKRAVAEGILKTYEG